MMEGKVLGDTILLVDDDSDLINLYVDFMKFLDFERIITANNGEEAITKYEAYQPDLVLMDVDMPKMNGVAAFHRIKNLDKDADVIFLTSDSSNPELIGLKEDYTVEIISKNTPLSTLEVIIQKHLALSTKRKHQRTSWLLK